MRVRIATAIVAAALLPSSVLAQTPAQDASRAGENIGGAVGGIVGAAIELPGEVLSAVTGAPRPNSVQVQEEVAVGKPLPARVAVRPVPSHSNYGYAVVNNQRVVVDAKTRRVVKIVD
ncbi:MAG: DUF1236 domain-containing protein [Xanthobacteraceae bacterium]